VSLGSKLSLEVHANSGDQKLARWSFEITADDYILAPDISQGTNWVEAGADGGTIGEINANGPGPTFVNGYSLTGEGPGEDLHLLTTHWTAVGAGPPGRDTWEWHGTGWTDVSPGGTEGTDFPTARYYHAMTYDSTRSAVVLFGGYDVGYCSDTWVFRNVAVPWISMASMTNSFYTGDVQIDYMAHDNESDNLNIEVQYSTDSGGTWDNCTEGGGSDGKTDLTASRPGSLHKFVWDSLTDLGNNYFRVILRMRGDDGTFLGLWYETIPFTVSNMDCGSLVWAKSAGSASDDDYGRGISALSDGSVIVTGWFAGDTTFGNASEGNETVLSSAGSTEIFIAKYNPDGTLTWAKSAGGTGTDRGYSISTLPDGSAVVTGYFFGTATFGNASEGNETVLLSAGGTDIFIAKYNPDGTLAWAKSAGGGGDEEGLGISVLSDGSAIVTGDFTSLATFGNASEGNETDLTSAGSYDIFIAKYNPDGTLNWAKSAGRGGDNYGYGISAISEGSAIEIGSLINTGTFGNASEGNETVLTAAGTRDIFITKYNPDGTLAWAKSAGGGDGDVGEGISTFSDGSAIVTGYYASTATFGNASEGGNEIDLTSDGSNDIFIAKYNPDGTLDWAKSAGGTVDDRGWGISTLSDGSAIVTGWIQGTTATFGNASEGNETVLTLVGANDIFIAKYNPDGTLAWAKNAGSLSTDEGYGISALPDGSAVVTGYFESTATFGALEVNETPLSSAGGRDIFIAKYSP